MPSYRFGPFYFDLQTGQLLKGGTRIRLQRKPQQLLQVLLQHAGEAVTREQLRAHLWPSEAYGDFETGLNVAVKKLRDALCDSADKPLYVATEVGVGYRFIADVEESLTTEKREKEQPGHLSSDEHKSSSPSHTLVRGIFRRRAASLAVVSTCLLVLLLIIYPGFGGPGSARRIGHATTRATFGETGGSVALSLGTISTVAGNGIGAFSADGNAAENASLQLPVRVIVDEHGDLYISDYGNSRVRKVDQRTGHISTIAGDGNEGFRGDGGLATSASLNHPGGVAFDSRGNLYVADSDNHRIRKIDAATSKISTVAGNGVAGFSGDGGLATRASLYYPSGVAVDRTNSVYIVDMFNNRVRKLEAKTGIITTVAGNGTTALGRDGVIATHTSVNFPHGIAIDSAGNLYIAEEDNHRIRKVNAETGVITTIAGTGEGGFSGDGGPATNARLHNPRDVALDSAGNIYIADHRNSRIRRVDYLTGEITTVAGNGNAWFNGDGGAAVDASLYLPVGATVDGKGDLYIADTYNGRIRRVKMH